MSSWMPGGQPSTTQPIAGPWLSPQVVMRKRWPKLLCDMGFLCAQVPTLSLPARIALLILPLRRGERRESKTGPGVQAGGDVRNSKANGLLAATRRRPGCLEGDGAPKSANPTVPGPLPDTAGASRRANRSVCSASGPLSALGADGPQVVSQLLAGTPSGPGGSSAAARVPCCGKARRRHTSSRHYERLAMTPSADEVGA